MTDGIPWSGILSWTTLRTHSSRTILTIDTYQDHPVWVSNRLPYPTYPTYRSPDRAPVGSARYLLLACLMQWFRQGQTASDLHRARTACVLDTRSSYIAINTKPSMNRRSVESTKKEATHQTAVFCHWRSSIILSLTWERCSAQDASRRHVPL